MAKVKKHIGQIESLNAMVIPHDCQRYNTEGDYGIDGSTIWVTLSKMKNPYSPWLVFVHELVEIILCMKDGVDFKDIDKFDMVGDGRHSTDPGLMTQAPYHKQHLNAVKIEKKVCKMLGLDWKKHYNNQEQ